MHINVALIAFAAAHISLSIVCVQLGGAIGVTPQACVLCPGVLWLVAQWRLLTYGSEPTHLTIVAALRQLASQGSLLFCFINGMLLAGLIGADSINMLLRICFSLVFVRLLFRDVCSFHMVALCPSRTTTAALLLAFLITGDSLRSCFGLFLHECLVFNARMALSHPSLLHHAGMSAPLTLGAKGGGPVIWLLRQRHGSPMPHLLHGCSFWTQTGAHAGVGCSCLAVVLLVVRRADGTLWQQVAAMRRRGGSSKEGSAKDA